ncbi:hypothetical protein CH063_15526 [Colletotrichum higginsianum]|uniref:Secreted protein n=1 Tax=Colletotrichum higginsianum (strain IMI 349063) TaxID=759273 RepID=H1W389_COLHI|nr:hypothetical protein CH063_15526 [Colletotrichum higginsianum]
MMSAARCEACCRLSCVCLLTAFSRVFYTSQDEVGVGAGSGTLGDSHLVARDAADTVGQGAAGCSFAVVM